MVICYRKSRKLIQCAVCMCVWGVHIASPNASRDIHLALFTPHVGPFLPYYIGVQLSLEMANVIVFMHSPDSIKNRGHKFTVSLGRRNCLEIIDSLFRVVVHYCFSSLLPYSIRQPNALQEV